jgi:hypothetical protein
MQINTFYGGVGVERHSLWTSAVDGVEWAYHIRGLGVDDGVILGLMRR